MLHLCAGLIIDPAAAGFYRFAKALFPDNFGKR
jgi:hypothetical protein